MENLDRLNKIVSEKSNWIEEAKQRQDNKAWLKHSQKIAIKILKTLRENKNNKTGISSQVQLAEILGVKPQYVNKLVKGKENLTLETISKIEVALNIKLISDNKVAIKEIVRKEYIVKKEYVCIPVQHFYEKEEPIMYALGA